MAAVEDVLSNVLDADERAIRLKTRVLKRFSQDAGSVRLKAFLAEIGLAAA